MIIFLFVAGILLMWSVFTLSFLEGKNAWKCALWIFFPLFFLVCVFVFHEGWSCWLKTTRGWINNDWIVIFVWSIPLKLKRFIMLLSHISTTDDGALLFRRLHNHQVHMQFVFLFSFWSTFFVFGTLFSLSLTVSQQLYWPSLYSPFSTVIMPNVTINEPLDLGHKIWCSRSRWVSQSSAVVSSFLAE